MSFKPNLRSLADKQVNVFANLGKKVSVSIPRDNFIQKMMMRMDLVYTTAGGASVAEDGILNILKNITLTADGNDTKRSMALKRLYYLNVLAYSVKPELVDIDVSVAAGKAASVSFEIGFFGKQFHPDDLDYSALLPASEYSSLELIFDIDATTALGTNQTITAGTLDISVKEIPLDASEIRQLYGSKLAGKPVRFEKLSAISETEDEQPVSAALSNYGFVYELPTSGTLLRSVIFPSQSALRNDALVTGFKIRDNRTKQDLKEESWKQAQSRDKYEYGISAPLEAASNFVIKGMAVCDYQEIGNLDMRNVKKGDITLNMTTTTPTAAKIVFINTEVQ